ncbi:MAG: pyridoxal-phosphate dependent enzyme [Gammaproteobacteria bacterium]
MAVHISDSAIYRNSWSTPELRELFDDAALAAGWVEVIAVLAETEAEFALIPAAAARQIAETCRNLRLDPVFFTEVREVFEMTNHSLLGLIRALQKRCPENSGEWLCYGATVQDITDTHMARILGQVRDLFGCHLDAIVAELGRLASRYRDTPMCGRTHGQQGLPITFGFKAAGWLDEIQRHRLRLREVGGRIAIGQLAGGVGSLSAFGPEGLNLQKRFCAKLGLSAPVISWTAARDRIAEWLNLLALVSATADRIGHEIYNLQRPEIGEVREGFVSGTVGSITMPQKRNPEISEHLGTLARVVRYQAAHMAENLVHDHERDGRSWKGEWVILPGACLATGKALALLTDLLRGLEVDAGRMERNLLGTHGAIQAERVMLALTPALGKQSAHELVYRVAMDAAELGIPFREAVLADTKLAALLEDRLAESLFSSDPETGSCAGMVDRVLADTFATGFAARQIPENQSFDPKDPSDLAQEARGNRPSNPQSDPWNLLARFPRQRLAEFPTPLLPMHGLSRAIGGATIWFKRDDLISFGFGGNKVRGLEFLVAAALAEKAEVIVTGAGIQSNHVRATAAAASRFGLDCTAVFWGDPPAGIDGNYRITRLLGAEAVFTRSPDRDSVDSGIEQVARALRDQGRRVYAIPRGGACALGALGHMLAARELHEQCRDFEPHRIVMATGSGGTHAGWLLGSRALGSSWKIESFTVSREPREARVQIARLATEAARMLGLDWLFAADEVTVHGGFLGPGYGIPTAEAADAIRLVARTEGVLLDPTYTGKAMAGLLDQLRNDSQRDRAVVFLHSGGEPAFFAGDGKWLSGCI